MRLCGFAVSREDLTSRWKTILTAWWVSAAEAQKAKHTVTYTVRKHSEHAAGRGGNNVAPPLGHASSLESQSMANRQHS